MLAFNRAIVPAPLPSSNIILGFVLGDDFVQTGIANTQTALSLPLSFLQERTTSNTATVPKWIHGGNTERAPFFPHSPSTELSWQTEMTQFKSPLPLLCTPPAAASRQESSLPSCMGIPPALGNHNVLLASPFHCNFGIRILAKIAKPAIAASRGPQNQVKIREAVLFRTAFC